MTPPAIPYASKYYLTSPYTFQLETVIKEVHPVDPTSLGLIMDTTIFRPAGGGQELDHGTLTIQGHTYPVSDLQENEHGEILHTINAGDNTVAPGQKVQLHLDADRRLALMRSHTGQHILARELSVATHQKPLKVHITPDHGQLVYPATQFDWALLTKMETQVNQLIQESRPIHSRFYTSLEEVHAVYGDTIRIGIRGTPSYIRVISIKAYDAAACTGTHLSNTREVQSLKILNLRTTKKTVLVDFAVGPQISSTTYPLFNQLWPIAQSLSTGLSQLPQKLHRLQHDLTLTQTTLRLLEDTLIPVEAKRLLQAGTQDHDVFVAVEKVPYASTKGGFQILDTALTLLAAQDTPPTERILGLLIGDHHPQVLAKIQLAHQHWQKPLQSRMQGRGTIKTDFAIFPVPTGTTREDITTLFKSLITAHPTEQ